jgi:zinc protease
MKLAFAVDGSGRGVRGPSDVPLAPARGNTRRAATARCALLIWRIFVACAVVWFTGPAQAAPQTVTLPATGKAHVLRATLANGLRVVVVRNTLAPVAAISVNYLVGSTEAPADFPGMAHAQEHMMFRGSPGLSADQLAAIGSTMGGDFNANTREGLTQYLFTVPAEDLDVALHIEAVRMQGVLDTQQGWDHERGAIEQEVAQDLSEPAYLLYSKTRAALFAGTAYEHDALGTKRSFDATTAQMLKRFHDTWYAPNNAILVIAGDVDPATTVRKVEQLFGAIKAKTLPQRTELHLRPVRPASFHVDTDAPTGTLMLAMRTPGPRSADFPALEILAEVLSSRRFDLYGLVPQGKAVDASFGLDPLPQAGLAYATVAFTAAEDRQTIQNEVRSILARVARDGVPAELVDAAKMKERSAAQFQRNSIADLAAVWSDALALYGLQSPDEDLARIEKVTVEDVKRVARKYLDLEHAVTGIMLPQPSGQPVASGSAGFGGREAIALDQEKTAKLPDWAAAAVHRLSVPRTMLHPVVSTLPNGLTLIVQPENTSDTVSVYGHIRNRPETQEPVGQEGVAEVLDQLLEYGTGHLDRLAFQQAIDAIGASATAGTDFSVQTLAEHFDRAVELLADNQLHPALPQPAMTVIQAQLAQGLAAWNVSPRFRTEQSLRKALFPANDPSLRVPTPATVAALTLDGVRAYYRAAFRPDLTTIVVIGNVTPEQARAVIEKHFGTWQASGPQPVTDLPPVTSNRPRAIQVPNARRVQDSVILAENLGINRAAPDFYALELGNAVLDGGFYASRFSIALRKNSGLVYSVGSALQAGRTRTVYSIQYACDPQNVAKAADIVRRQIHVMQTTPVGADELLRAKALLVRRIALSEADIDGIARALLARSDLSLPLDEPEIAARRYIRLRAADVQAAFQHWLHPQDLVLVSEGPAAH